MATQLDHYQVVVSDLEVEQLRGSWGESHDDAIERIARGKLPPDYVIVSASRDVARGATVVIGEPPSGPYGSTGGYRLVGRDDSFSGGFSAGGTITAGSLNEWVDKTSDAINDAMEETTELVRTLLTRVDELEITIDKLAQRIEQLEDR